MLQLRRIEAFMTGGDMNTMKKCSTCGNLYAGDLCPKCMAGVAQKPNDPTVLLPDGDGGVRPEPPRSHGSPGRAPPAARAGLPRPGDPRAPGPRRHGRRL